MSEEDTSHVLAVVLDMHPSIASEGTFIENYLQGAMSFLNMYLGMSAYHSIAVIAASHKRTKFLFPNDSIEPITEQPDGQLELLASMNNTFRKSIVQMAEEDDASDQTDSSDESLIAGAIGRALLYVRHESLKDVRDKKVPRVLVLKCSADSGGQYLNYINVFLTAQKIGAVLDTCIIDKDSGLLQQGADITGGFYYKIDSVDKLFQTLIMYFLPNAMIRKKLAYPYAKSVDYRASCFCHRTLVDMANVCSNCLSVYCKAVPLCSTCGVFFKTDVSSETQDEEKSD